MRFALITQFLAEHPFSSDEILKRHLQNSSASGTHEAPSRCVTGRKATNDKKGERDVMKYILITAAAITAMSSIAHAQTATVTTTAPSATTQITIAPEQRTKIKSYVTTQKVQPITVKEKVVVGATLPADVTLQTVPADWGPDVTKYRYVYVDNHVAFVDPSSRKVVTIVD
jgi:hypothetical protein